MRTFFILWKQEIATFFRTPLAYVVMVAFLLLTGFNFYASVNILNHGPTEISIVEAFFNTSFFWACLFLISPLLTMKLFSEEYKSGTIETLMTAPVRPFQVVLAKFFGVFFLFAVLWAPTVIYFALFWPSIHQIAAASYGAYAGAYGMLLLLGMFYLSIGCFYSAMTRHQLISGMLSFSTILVLFFLSMTTSLHTYTGPYQENLVTFFSPIENMTCFSRGLIDTRPIICYLSLTGFMLFLTFQIFQSRTWRR